MKYPAQIPQKIDPWSILMTDGHGNLHWYNGKIKGVLKISDKIPAWRFDEHFINKACSLVFYPTHEGELYARDFKGNRTRIEGQIGLVKQMYNLIPYDGFLSIYRKTAITPLSL